MKTVAWLVFVGVIASLGCAYSFFLFTVLFGTQIIFDWVGRTEWPDAI